LVRYDLQKAKTAFSKSSLQNRVASLCRYREIFKGSLYPNAALLLAGWLAGPDGQKAYDQLGRGSPFVQESITWNLIRKSRSKTVFEGLDRPEYEPGIIKRIVSS
jgi:hypothetical protein